MKYPIKELVKDRMVSFSHLRQGVAYYVVESASEEGNNLQFAVPLDDIGTATLQNRDKAMFFMRWIRKSNDAGELIEIK